MASTALGMQAAVCKFCGKPFGIWRREYLDIKPLCSHELPPLGRRSVFDHAKYISMLAEFLQRVIGEAYQVDFDGDDWIPHGKFPSGEKLYVSMPPLPDTSNAGPDAPGYHVPVEVDMRAKGNTSSAWLARSSRHQRNHVEYTEMDDLLARNHCGKEVSYTPSVFDANELFKWKSADLQEAVAELKPEWRITSVQMSIYQMCHEMPKVSRMSLLRDRIFHVLCITAHSSYDAPEDVESGLRSQSHTLQLPIDIESFQDIVEVTTKSHYQMKSKTYDSNDIKITGDETTQKGKERITHQGNRLTEGVYVSLERLREGPRTVTGLNETHLWDMMTRSDARGITCLAPWGTRKRETLDAIAKDVHYVLEHIRRQRRSRAGSGDAPIPM